MPDHLKTFYRVACVVAVISLFVIGYVIGRRSCTTYTDCGTCGAHVAEWYYIQGADGSPCPVCEYCYQIFSD